MEKLEAKDCPWGKWEVLLDENYCKVKRITVKPGHRLSYQKHHQREEIWIVVKGSGQITLDGKITDHKEGDIIEVPCETAHRVGNNSDSDFVFIEIQRGSYFGEDDIVRLEDDYGRI